MSIVDKIARHFNKFLDVRIIFFIDLFLSLLASFFALLVLGFLRSDNYTTGPFATLWITSALVAIIISKLVFKSHKIVIRYTTFANLGVFVLEVLLQVVLMACIIIAFKEMHRGVIFALLADFLLTLFLLLFTRMVMIFTYRYYLFKKKEDKSKQRVLIYGTSEKSLAAVVRLRNSNHYKLVGFISKSSAPHSMKIDNMPVYDYNAVKDVVNENSVDAILFTTEKDAYDEQEGLIKFCSENDLRPMIIPTIDEFVQGKAMKNQIRSVRIEDLLGREEIRMEMGKVEENFKDKVVMVTGAAGSIGSELCRQLAGFGVKQLILFDNAETPMHNIRLELEERFPNMNFVPFIGDVRQQPRLKHVFERYRPQIVFHAAAYKHVPLMEENPCEALRVNVLGTHNVADKCVEYGVEKMVMISTDKAVNPTNIMGCSKRLAEIYVQSLGLAIESGRVQGKTKFVTTRFGNVLGSNGSVIPRFREQIEKGGPVTVTHPDITRFFMTIPEACRLVMEAATFSTGTQIFVFDMGESVKISTLAYRMIELAGLKPGVDIDIEYTGLRPGEKLYEEVLSNKENTIETEHKRIFIAKVRKYEYEEVLPEIQELEYLSEKVLIPEMVMKMKTVVPEFISMNSEFEKFDLKK